jgi:hypothetical protein
LLLGPIPLGQDDTTAQEVIRQDLVCGGPPSAITHKGLVTFEADDGPLLDAANRSDLRGMVEIDDPLNNLF